MGTLLYSLLHFFVDFLCAHAMYRLFAGGIYSAENILIYNFCAFALQMPLGALLDSFADHWKRLPEVTAALGVMLTALGSFVHPALLGLGNALFHVGGGVAVIHEDHARHWKGRALGVFVAPGALGLFLGGQISVDITLWLILAMFGLTVPLFRIPSIQPLQQDAPTEKKHLIPLICCFLVVILRSYVGLSTVFSWKVGFLPGLVAVSAVVLGKMAGGLAAARIGARMTAVVSRGWSALCYLWGDVPVMGIVALFFFNMTMPITLYQLWLRWPQFPGTVFGILTFGLFLGFLPVCLGWDIPLNGAWGSLLSLILLLPVVWRNRQWT